MSNVSRHTHTSMPKSTKNATPLWREFEQLVARVEQVMAGDRVKVTSPDRVRSLLTGRRREVDASIRTTIGSSEILVTVECRRRSATQDVTWLEQLGCKKQAIGAARTIAVSSSTFSSDAIRVAEYYGIDLRNLSEISDADMRNWMLPQFVVHVFKQCDLTESPEITFEEEKGDDFTAFLPMKNIENGVANLDSAVFISSDGTMLTLNDLWLRADEQHKIFDGVPTDDQVHMRRLTLTSVGDILKLRTRLGERSVKKITMALALRWKHERIGLDAANVVLYQAASASDPMPRQLRAEFQSTEAKNANIRLGLQFQPGQSITSFTLDLTPGTK